MEKIGRCRYRHWAQGIAFVLAIIFTIYVNANSLELLHQLTTHPLSRAWNWQKIQSGPAADHTANHARAMDNLRESSMLLITSDTLSGKGLSAELASDPFLHNLLGSS